MSHADLAIFADQEGLNALTLERLSALVSRIVFDALTRLREALTRSAEEGTIADIEGTLAQIDGALFDDGGARLEAPGASSNTGSGHEDWEGSTVDPVVPKASIEEDSTIAPVGQALAIRPSGPCDA